MIDEAVECETQFAEDLLVGGVRGPVGRRHARSTSSSSPTSASRTLGLPKRYGAKNPFAFMDLQDVQEVDELLRAPRLGLPGRRHRRRRLRRRLLISTSKIVRARSISRAQNRVVRIVIEGRNLPGRRFEEHGNVHVGLQERREPVGLVPGDAPSAKWALDVAVVGPAGDRDFRGPAVQGKRGERFVYLTWGDVAATAHSRCSVGPS